MPRNRRVLRTFAAAVVGVVALTAWAAPTGKTVSFAQYGDALSPLGSRVLALSPVSAIVATEGPDGLVQTADDTLLFLGDLDGGGEVTPIPTGAHPAYFTLAYAYPERLSATTVVMGGSGVDGASYTPDDVLNVITGVGSTNTVTPVTVGFMPAIYSAQPRKLSSDAVVLGSIGPDGLFTTADDALVLIDDIGGTNRVTRLNAPRANFGAQPEPLSPTSAVVSSAGNDGASGTTDDLVYLFTDLGGTNAVTPLATPFLNSSFTGLPVRVGPTRAVVVAEGPDGVSGTLADEIFLLDDLGRTDAVIPITMGPAVGGSAGRPVALSNDLVVVTSQGLDSTTGTPDDELVVISGLGTTNTVTRIVIGPIVAGSNSRPSRLSPTSCAVRTRGGDTLDNTLDDVVMVIRDVGGANTVVPVGVVGMARFATSELAVISATSFMVTSGGPDGAIGSGPVDVITLVSGLDGVSLNETLDITGLQPLTFGGASPRLLGHGRGAHMDVGPNNSVSTGGDDLFRVIEGLPRDRELTAQKIDIKFRANKPQKPAKVSLKASLVIDVPALFTSGDVTISIGATAQTIPLTAFEIDKKGAFVYLDKKRVNGFIQKLTYDPFKQLLKVKGKGVAIGAENTAAGYVPVAIEVAELYIADAVVGKAKKSGIKYRAPK